MQWLILGLVIFLGTHSIGIFAPGWRDRMRASLGEKPWKGMISLLSIAGFVLLCYGFAVARATATTLYVSPTWVRHVAALLMLPVFPLLFAAYLPGRIRATLKHPMLVAVKLWAMAHLLANGRSVDLLLFGGLLAWAVLDRISWKRRPPQALQTAPARPWNDSLAVALGLAAYGIFVLWAHVRLFGVAPLGVSM